MSSTICYIHPYWLDVLHCQFCAHATQWRTLGIDAPNSNYPNLSSVLEQHPRRFSPISLEDDYPDRFALSSDEAESEKDDKKAREGAKLGRYRKQALKEMAESIPKDQRKRRGRPPVVIPTQDSETEEENKKSQALRVKEQELEQANTERRKNEVEMKRLNEQVKVLFKKLDEVQMSPRPEPFTPNNRVRYFGKRRGRKAKVMQAQDSETEEEEDMAPKRRGRKPKVTQSQDSETEEEEEISKSKSQRRKRKAVRFEDSESEEHQPTTRKSKRNRNRVDYALAQVDSDSD